MNKIECKIIQDLLANYVEDLTSVETNEFIENHLAKCKECKKVADIMKKGLEEEENKTKYQIDYLKKYRRKTLALKIFASFVIVIALAFLGVKCYQWNFLLKIYKHNVEFDVGNNYRLISRDGANIEEYTEMIYKDGTGYIKMNDNGIIWEDETSKYMIIEEDKKYIELNKSDPPLGLDSRITINTYGLFDINNKNELLKTVLTNAIDIHEEEYGEYQCYVVLYKGGKIWIDKETLFIIREDYEGKTTEYFLEENTVTENDIKVPNLDEYTKIN